jgi:hypothetical protein
VRTERHRGQPLPADVVQLWVELLANAIIFDMAIGCRRSGGAYATAGLFVRIGDVSASKVSEQARVV